MATKRIPSPGPRIVLVAGLVDGYSSIRDILLGKIESILKPIIGPRVGSRGRRGSVGGILSLFSGA